MDYEPDNRRQKVVYHTDSELLAFAEKVNRHSNSLPNYTPVNPFEMPTALTIAHLSSRIIMHPLVQYHTA